eukprot:Hpha_TRINITY_DN12048_c1_g1::TRINITY_DN12048_c1_g1_i1::g.140971::m.140971
MTRLPSRFNINLRLTVLLIFVDVGFSGCILTVHHKERSVEDLINIGLLSAHLLLYFCHLGMIWLSVAPTVKYTAGLIGELTQITVSPTSFIVGRACVMAVPWVYRRWLLKGKNDLGVEYGKLYWDDAVYTVSVGLNMALMFGFISAVMAMHYQLTKASNYRVDNPFADAVDEERLLRRPTFFVEARRWDDPTEFFASDAEPPQAFAPETLDFRHDRAPSRAGSVASF